MKSTQVQFLLFLLSLLYLPGCGSTDPFPTFTENISNTSTASVTPAIAVDASGNINVVWEENGKIVFSRFTAAGLNLTFSVVNQIIFSAGPAVKPAVAVDTSGNLDVVWEEGSDVFFSQVTFSTVSGVLMAVPTTPKNISNTAKAHTPAVGVDGSGNISVVWEDDTPGNAEIFFSIGKFIGVVSFFSTPVNISNGSGVSQHPRVAVQCTGPINVIWDDTSPGPNSAILFSRAIPTNTATCTTLPGETTTTTTTTTTTSTTTTTILGTTTTTTSTTTTTTIPFSPPLIISQTPSVSSLNPAVALDLLGNIYAVWQENGEIFFSSSSAPTIGTNFLTPKNINTSTASVTPAIAVDNSTKTTSGNIYAVWQEGSPGEIFFSSSTDGGVSFSPGQNISKSPGSSILPAVAVSQSGSVRTVWEDDSTGNDEIFFAVGD